MTDPPRLARLSLRGLPTAYSTAFAPCLARHLCRPALLTAFHTYLIALLFPFITLQSIFQSLPDVYIFCFLYLSFLSPDLIPLAHTPCTAPRSAHAILLPRSTITMPLSRLLSIRPTAPPILSPMIHMRQGFSTKFS